MSDPLKEDFCAREFAVERWTKLIVGGKTRWSWQPIGIFLARDRDGAIEQAAFACQRISLLRAYEFMSREEFEKILQQPFLPFDK